MTINSSEDLEGSVLAEASGGQGVPRSVGVPGPCLTDSS